MRYAFDAEAPTLMKSRLVVVPVWKFAKASWNPVAYDGDVIIFTLTNPVVVAFGVKRRHAVEVPCTKACLKICVLVPSTSNGLLRTETAPKACSIIGCNSLTTSRVTVSVDPLKL